MKFLDLITSINSLYVISSVFTNSNQGEDDQSAYNTIDIVSNGFKCRGGSSGSGTGTNESGGSYVYMAFAEAPLVGSNNVPCTAR